MELLDSASLLDTPSLLDDVFFELLDSSLPLEKDSTDSLDEESSELLELKTSCSLDEDSSEVLESTVWELLDKDSSDAHDPITSISPELDDSPKSLALEPLSPPQAASNIIEAKERPRHSFRIITPY